MTFVERLQKLRRAAAVLYDEFMGDSDFNAYFAVSTECAMLVHEECKGKARRPGASRFAALIGCTCSCHEGASVLSSECAICGTHLETREVARGVGFPTFTTDTYCPECHATRDY